MLAWERQWNEGLRDTYRAMYRKAHEVAPTKPMGWRIWHTNSFAPFYRAEQDYAAMAGYSDFLKVVMLSYKDDIDGLVHISQLSEDHVAKVKDVLKVGQEVEARVIKVDKVERRIGLSVKAANYSEEELKRESEAFDSLRPGEDMVGLEKAFEAAAEDYRPGERKEEVDASNIWHWMPQGFNPMRRIRSIPRGSWRSCSN